MNSEDFLYQHFLKEQITPQNLTLHPIPLEALERFQQVGFRKVTELLNVWLKENQVNYLTFKLLLDKSPPIKSLEDLLEMSAATGFKSLALFINQFLQSGN